jgi:hypothetical protein
VRRLRAWEWKEKKKKKGSHFLRQLIFSFFLCFSLWCFVLCFFGCFLVFLFPGTRFVWDWRSMWFEEHVATVMTGSRPSKSLNVRRIPRICCCCEDLSTSILFSWCGSRQP